MERLTHITENYYVQCALTEFSAGFKAFGDGLKEIFVEDDWENMEGGPSSTQDKTQGENTADAKTSESSQQPEHSTNTNASSADITSPTDTVSTTTDSTTTTTDSSNQDVSKDVSSAETLTIVSGDSQMSDITQEAESDGNHDNKDLVTKEKGDIVVVGGDNSGSEGTSPANSDSHNKESTDEDWEKDFDIEVTEEELQQAKAEGATKGENKDGEEEEDWENWE